MEKKEREKSPEEMKILELINDATNELRRRYGLEDFDVPSKNVHLIKRDKWSGEDAEGRHCSPAQWVFVREQPTNALFAKTALHEMVHFKSYHAVQKRGKERIMESQCGLSFNLDGGKKMNLVNLNEAVTEQVIKNIAHNLFKDSLFAKDIKFLEERYQVKDKDGNLRKWQMFDGDICSEWIENGEVNGRKFSYAEQRDNLKKLCYKIYERNKDDFESPNEVLDVFVRAMLSGDIMPLRQLLEKTFGRPDRRFIFRRLVEADADVEEQRKFIESL